MKNISKILSLLLLLSSPLMAQELPPPSGDEANTLINDNLIDDTETDSQDPAPTSVDSDNTGNDPSSTDEQGRDTEEAPAFGNYTLTFEFTSHVQFTQYNDPAPYMEVQYSNKWETPINLSEKRSSAEGTLTVDVQNWGSLAQNEFFDCRLNINLQELPISAMAKLNKAIVEEDRANEADSAAVSIAFNGNLDEDWFSYCTDFLSGAVLNTEGAPENYNMQILKKIDPAIGSLIFENFKNDKTNTIPLIVAVEILNDADIKNNITLSGEGRVTLNANNN